MIKLCIASAVGLAIASTAHAGIVDSTFNTADWSLTSYEYGPFGGGAEAAQVVSGNPEFARRVSNSCGPNTSGSTNVSLYTAFAYIPAISGPLTELSFSIDSAYIDGLSAYGFVVQQGSGVWGVGYALTGPSWVTWTLSPVDADVFPIAPGTTGMPDFSAAGGPIRFGFYSANSSTGFGYTHTSLFDNFAVNFVPAPSAMMMAGLAGLAAARRRR
jgi:hypothetical protein